MLVTIVCHSSEHALENKALKMLDSHATSVFTRLPRRVIFLRVSCMYVTFFITSYLRNGRMHYDRQGVDGIVSIPYSLDMTFKNNMASK